MPPKKRTARTVPKPTIMVAPHLPPDLPAPTTTRDRQPRAHTASTSRTTRQSTLRSEGKLSSVNHTRPAMQRPASSSSRREAHEDPSFDTQDLEDFRNSGNHEAEEGVSTHEHTGHTPVVDDAGSGALSQQNLLALRVVIVCDSLSRTVFNWPSYASL